MTTPRRHMLWALLMLVPSGLRSQDSFPIDVRIGVHTASTKRNTSLANEITARSSGTVTGLEATVEAAGGGVGIAGRLLSGSYENGDLSSKEVRGFIGGEWFRIEGAYGQRSAFGTDSMFNVVKAGARLMIPVGGSGVLLALGGSKYFPGDFSEKRSDLTETDGWEGETALFYTLPMVPVYLQFGYRNEYFKQGTRAENLSGLIFGGGLWVGGR